MPSPGYRDNADEEVDVMWIQYRSHRCRSCDQLVICGSTLETKCAAQHYDQSYICCSRFMRPVGKATIIRQPLSTPVKRRKIRDQSMAIESFNPDLDPGVNIWWVLCAKMSTISINVHDDVSMFAVMWFLELCFALSMCADKCMCFFYSASL